MKRYDPSEYSKATKTLFTVIVLVLAPFTALLSRILVSYIWHGTLPFTSTEGTTSSQKIGHALFGIIVLVVLAFIVAIVVANLLA